MSTKKTIIFLKNSSDTISCDKLEQHDSLTDFFILSGNVAINNISNFKIDNVSVKKSEISYLVEGEHEIKANTTKTNDSKKDMWNWCRTQ